MIQLKEGDTFLYQYPSDDNHLFIIIAKKIAVVSDELQYVCVMVSSWKDKSPLCDPACKLKAGIHPFIHNESYIAYRETVMFSESLLDNLLGNGIAIPRDSVSSELLKNIKTAAKQSRFIAPMMLEYFN